MCKTFVFFLVLNSSSTYLSTEAVLCNGITFVNKYVSPTYFLLLWGEVGPVPCAGADLPGGGGPGAARLRDRPGHGHHGDQAAPQDTEVPTTY